MNFDRNTLMAIVVCLLFYLGYSHYLNSKYPEHGRRLPGEVASSDAPANGTESPANTAPSSATTGGSVIAGQPASNGRTNQAPAAEVPQLSEADLTLETPTATVRFRQDIAGIQSIQLKEYQATLARKGENPQPVELLTAPLSVQGIVTAGQTSLLVGYQAERTPEVLRFIKSEGPWRIVQEWSIDQSAASQIPGGSGYGLNLVVTYQNASNVPAELNAGVLLSKEAIVTAKQSSWIPGSPIDAPAIISSIRSSVTHINAESHCRGENNLASSAMNEPVDFFGFESHYFITALIPKAEKINFTAQRTGPFAEPRCPLAITAYQPQGQIPPGQSVTLSFRSYFGPKNVDIMKEYQPALKGSVNLGWFSVIAHPLLAGIKLIEKYVGNYGIAIIIVTALLKILFYPLMKSSAVSMRRMQKLQPQIQAIRERYKDDTRTRDMETMKFMRDNKVNPLKGCLPILPQFPVFVALYNVLNQSIELRHASFFFWIRDLSASDPFYVTPIILGGLMFVQQKLTPMTGLDPAQQKVMMMLPVLFAVMMLGLPSGLVLYMLTNTVISILQQQWLNRKLASI